LSMGERPLEFLISHFLEKLEGRIDGGSHSLFGGTK
jgi:hypothetical protein